jgi:hypothetical protein
LVVLLSNPHRSLTRIRRKVPARRNPRLKGLSLVKALAAPLITIIRRLVKVSNPRELTARSHL